MKVLNVCHSDWANYMHGQTQALIAAGVDASDCKLQPHVFEYAQESPVVSQSTMLKHMRDADIIQVFHSSKVIANLIRDNAVKAKVTVWHTGSDYRSNPEAITDVFHRLGVCKSFTDQCEFLMIDPNLIYVTVAIDVEGLRRLVNPHGFERLQGSKYAIAHYPSKSDVKGSEAILRLIEPLKSKFIFQYSDEKVSHTKQICRMDACDIYIELFQPTLNGKPYGCYGVTAFEAAALGKVVVTQNIYQQAYWKAYGCDLPFEIANTENEFSTIVQRLSDTRLVALERKKSDTFEWVRDHHSLLATGLRVKNILLAL